MPSLNAEQLQQLMAAGEGVHVVHVLPAVSFAKARIPGSVNISFYEDGFADRVEALAGGRDVPVVVYCLTAGCNASERAARRLEESGFSAVYDFAGGVSAWEQAGLPVHRGPRP